MALSEVLWLLPTLSISETHASSDERYIGVRAPARAQAARLGRSRIGNFQQESIILDGRLYFFVHRSRRLVAPTVRSKAPGLIEGNSAARKHQAVACSGAERVFEPKTSATSMLAQQGHPGGGASRDPPFCGSRLAQVQCVLSPDYRLPIRPEVALGSGAILSSRNPS